MPYTALSLSFATLPNGVSIPLLLLPKFTSAYYSFTTIATTIAWHYLYIYRVFVAHRFHGYYLADFDRFVGECVLVDGIFIENLSFVGFPFGTVNRMVLVSPPTSTVV